MPTVGDKLKIVFDELAKTKARDYFFNPEIYKEYERQFGSLNNKFSGIRSTLQSDKRFEMVQKGRWRLRVSGTGPTVSPRMAAPTHGGYKLSHVKPGELWRFKSSGKDEYGVVVHVGPWYPGRGADKFADAVWAIWASTSDDAGKAFEAAILDVLKPRNEGGELELRQYGKMEEVEYVSIASHPSKVTHVVVPSVTAGAVKPTPPVTPRKDPLEDVLGEYWNTTPPHNKRWEILPDPSARITFEYVTRWGPIGAPYAGEQRYALTMARAKIAEKIARGYVLKYKYSPSSAPTPAAPAPAPTPPVAPTPPPRVANQWGYCRADDKTVLKTLDPILEERNKLYGEHWVTGMDVTVEELSLNTFGAPFAVIVNVHGERWTSMVTNLACNDAPPAGATETTVPPAAPPAPTPAPSVAKPVADEIKSTVETPPPPPEIPKHLLPVMTNLSKVIRHISQKRFIFPGLSDTEVFFSTWFMRDGSCVLKGAPGSGKTVLLTLTGLTLGGSEWMRAVPRNMQNYKYILDWLAVHDYYGVAQYNADKEPEDVFFQTRIKIFKHGRPRSAPADEVSQYSFKPDTRPVVNSFVKLHNESNRLGTNVADALLGLLSEKYVEYKGQIFPSPRMSRKLHPEWVDAAERKLINPGHLNFFDYNPHLDSEGMEMDRALLDRIDVGIYLSAGGSHTRYKVIKNVRQREPSVPKAFFADLLDTTVGISPVDPLDIMQFWEIVDKIYVDDETLLWISFLTNLPNFTIRKYLSNSYFNWVVDPKDSTKAEAKPRDAYIDTTLLSYRPSKEKMERVGGSLSGGLEQLDEYSAIDAINRPLGSRAAISMLSLLRSVTFLRHIISPKYSLEFVMNDRKLKETDKNNWAENRIRCLNDLLMLLPYVLDHRVNLGVEKDIQNNFLNFADFIRFFFIPQIFHNKNRGPIWMECMDVITELTLPATEDDKTKYISKMKKLHPKAQVRSVADCRRLEFITLLASRLGKSRDSVENMFTDTTADGAQYLTHIFALAGSTLEWG
jgi:MoxR-like ATPase